MSAATESSLSPELAGAMAHLARAIKTGCRRSAHLCALLLDRVANAPEVDAHTRAHAQELIDALEGQAQLLLPAYVAPTAPVAPIASAQPAAALAHPVNGQPLHASFRTQGYVVTCH